MGEANTNTSNRLKFREKAKNTAKQIASAVVRGGVATAFFLGVYFGSRPLGPLVDSILKGDIRNNSGVLTLTGAQAQVPADKMKAVEKAKQEIDAHFQKRNVINYNDKKVVVLFNALKNAGIVKDPLIKTAEEWYRSIFGHGDPVNTGNWNAKVGPILAQAAPPAPAAAQAKTAPLTKAPTGMEGVARAARETAEGVRTAVPKKEPPIIDPFAEQTKPAPKSVPVPPAALPIVAPPVSAPSRWYNISEFTSPKVAVYRAEAAKQLQALTVLAGEMTIEAVRNSKFDNTKKNQLIARLEREIGEAKRTGSVSIIVTRYNKSFDLFEAISILVDAKNELEKNKGPPKHSNYDKVNGQLNSAVVVSILTPGTFNTTDAKRNALYYLRDILASNLDFMRFVTPRIERWKFRQTAVDLIVRFQDNRVENLMPGQDPAIKTLGLLLTAARQALDASGLRTARPDLSQIMDGMIREGNRLAASTAPADRQAIPHFMRRLNAGIVHAISLHELKLTLDNRTLVSPSRITDSSAEYQKADKAYKISMFVFQREFEKPKIPQFGVPEVGSDIALLALHSISSPVVIAFENAYTDWMAKRRIEEIKGAKRGVPASQVARSAAMREQDYADFEKSMLVAFSHYRDSDKAFRSWETIFSGRVQRTPALRMLEETYTLGTGPYEPKHFLSADTSLLNAQKGGQINYYLWNAWNDEVTKIRNTGFLSPTVDPALLTQARNAILKKYSEAKLDDLGKQIAAIRKTYKNNPAVLAQKLADLQTAHASALEAKYGEAAGVGRAALVDMTREAMARYTLVPYDRTNPDAAYSCDTTVKTLDIVRQVRDNPGRAPIDQLSALQLLMGFPPLPTGAGAAGARGPTTMPAQVVAEAPFIIRPKVQIMNAIDPKNRFVRVIDYEVISEGKTYGPDEFTKKTGRRVLNPAIDLNFGFVVYLQTNLDPQNPMYVANPGSRLGRSTNPYIGIKQGDKVILTQQKGNLSHVPVEEGTVLFNLVPGTTYPVQDALWEKNKGLVMIDSGTGKIANLPWTNIADARAVVDLIKEWKAGEVSTGPGPQLPPPPPPPALCPIPR